MKNPALDLDEPLPKHFLDELDAQVCQRPLPCSLDEFMALEMNLLSRYRQNG